MPKEFPQNFWDSRHPAHAPHLRHSRTPSPSKPSRLRWLMKLLGISALLLLLLLARPASAQLSPGPLHKVHANLEGVENCTRCHEVGKRLSPGKCLACHGALAARVNAGRGLHARPGHTACAECHVEHQGRETSLIWWGEKGVRAFDHAATGWRLTGKHATVDCSRCHRPESITDPEALRSGAANPATTFLGLRTDCAACHEDPHKGQLGTDCARCHSPETWKTSAAFDHNRARFVLTGKHLTVPCEKCHTATKRPEGKADGTARGAEDENTPGTRDNQQRQWRGLAFSNCSDCHIDPHVGRLGAACVTCHTSQGWKDVVTGRFDHERTRYPLRGRHATVRCNQCHRPNASIRGLAFARCVDCHVDPHSGQFTDGLDARGAHAARDCSDCHTVDGFAPTTYTIAAHAKTDYPLAGGHLAVPCSGCHTRSKPDAPRSTAIFRFNDTRCITCHRDPHKGQVDAAVQKGGCESCHRVESWSAVTFDHATTRMPLVGRHATARCSGCHRPTGPGNATGDVVLRGLPLDCAACHRDPHGAQFQDASTGTTRCDRCHTPANWKAETFDHDRDSSFKLDGAHSKAPCVGCHPRDDASVPGSMRFKPTPSACVACHGRKPQSQDAGGAQRKGSS